MEPPESAQPDRVRVGMISLGRWPVQIAKDRGFFANENLDVEISYTGHFEPLMQKLQAGELDIGHQAASHPLRLIEEGADMVIFMGERMGVSNVIVAQPEIQTYEDLKGRRVGCSGRGGQDCLLLRRMMARNGLNEQEWELVYGFNPRARYEALQAGEIDATIMGSARRVEEGYTILDEAPKYVDEGFQFSVALARRSWAEADPDRLVRYIRAYAAAMDWMSQPANKDEAVAAIARIGEMDLEQAESDLASVLERYNPKGQINVEGLRDVMENMAEFGLLPQPPPPLEKYVDLSYYEKAMQP